MAASMATLPPPEHQHPFSGYIWGGIGLYQFLG
jgi:hypothetical protein